MNTPHSPTDNPRPTLAREALDAERAELIAANNAATGWGAAVGARHERIVELDRMLASDAPASAGADREAVRELLRSAVFHWRGIQDDRPHPAEPPYVRKFAAALDLAAPSPATQEPVVFALVNGDTVDLYATRKQADFYAEHRGGTVRPVFYDHPAPLSSDAMPQGADKSFHEICLIAREEALHFPEELQGKIYATIIDAIRAAHPAPATPSPDARLRNALQNLEVACDSLASTRSPATYIRMMDADDAGGALILLDKARQEARAALAASPGAQDIIAPTKPTEAMLKAGGRAVAVIVGDPYSDNSWQHFAGEAERVYRAMVAASPGAQDEEGGRDA